MKVVIISGTPGCGKSITSKYISNYINAEVVTLNELVIKKDFVLEYDKERDTHVIDRDKLIPYLIELIEKLKKKKRKPDFLIIESHFSDIVPDNCIDYSIVLRCDPDKLFNRLKERGYNKRKIIENVQAEILGNCVNHLLQKKLKIPVLEIDTSNLSVEQVAKVIIDIIVHKKNLEKYYVGKVDWLEKISNNVLLIKKYLYEDI